MSEFKGTKGKWYHDKGTLSIWHPENIGQRIICVDSEYLGATEEQLANALLISKAPCFYEDAKNDLDLFDELLKSLPLGLQHLKNSIKERKKEKEKLIKQATDL